MAALESELEEALKKLSLSEMKLDENQSSIKRD